jgi:transposase-like protein
VVVSTMEPLAWLRKQLETADVDLLREMVSTFTAMLMGAEADALCGAAYGERSPERVNTRNGYRTRRFDTPAGTSRIRAASNRLPCLRCSVRLRVAGYERNRMDARILVMLIRIRVRGWSGTIGS